MGNKNQNKLSETVLVRCSSFIFRRFALSCRRLLCHIVLKVVVLATPVGVYRTNGSVFKPKSTGLYLPSSDGPQPASGAVSGASLAPGQVGLSARCHLRSPTRQLLFTCRNHKITIQIRILHPGTSFIWLIHPPGWNVT